jgi:hypothetical protein
VIDFHQAIANKPAFNVYIQQDSIDNQQQASAIIIAPLCQLQLLMADNIDNIYRRICQIEIYSSFFFRKR